MTREKTYRVLRITSSAVCGVLCVLLIALAVRSYYRWESVVWGVTAQQGFLLCSHSGAVIVEYINVSGTTATLYKWHVNSMPSPDTNVFPIGGIEESWAGFSIHGSWNGGFLISVPYWFLFPTCAVLAAVPWIQWSRRFSLRSLLIATTLVAVVLGVVVLTAH
jgi:hypothetical protein